MSAVILPFPLTKRSRLIARTASAAARYSRPARYLADTLRRQAETLRRYGVAADVIEAETAAFARALEHRLQRAA